MGAAKAAASQPSYASPITRLRNITKPNGMPIRMASAVAAKVIPNVTAKL